MKIKKKAQGGLSLKSVSFLFKELLFYRHIFTFNSLLGGFLNYLCYLAKINKITFNPLTINFLITTNCNLECDICSYHANRNSAINNLNIKEIEEFILTQAGLKPTIFFSGGEPLMRKDFIDIVRITKSYGLKCGLNTNAYLLDTAKSEKLIRLGINLLIFSLYGPEEVHDAITGVKGSYRKATDNISFFCRNKGRKTKVILNCAINEKNLDFLEDVPPIARKLNVDAVKLEHLNFLSRLEFEKNRDYFAQSKHSINTFVTDFNDPGGLFADKLIKKLASIKRNHGDFVLIKPGLTDEEIKNWYSNAYNLNRKCFFVWNSVFIRPDGAVVPCQFLLNYELGNIKEYGLRDIFRNQKMLHLRKTLEKGLLPECFRCCKL